MLMLSWEIYFVMSVLQVAANSLGHAELLAPHSEGVSFQFTAANDTSIVLNAYSGPFFF